MRIGINGFGRIGKNFLKAALLRHPQLQLVALNDLTPAKDCAHLFAHDSTYGAYPKPVEAGDGYIRVDGRRLDVFAERDPAKIPWAKAGVDLVIESTGFFTEADKARAHVAAGAKKVIISAPAKGEDLTVVLGVNDGAYDPARHHVISNASCTTNCLATTVKPLVDTFGWQRGFMTTVHAYTNDQNVLDAPHKDLRRARAAAVNIVPTSSGAAKALYLAVPETKGSFEGFALRVPTATVSMIYLVAQLAREASRAQVNEALVAAAKQGPLHGILHTTDAELVSSDFRGSPHSATIDLSLTQAMGELVQICAWYDNEWGYACRLADLAAKVANA